MTEVKVTWEPGFNFFVKRYSYIVTFCKPLHVFAFCLHILTELFLQLQLSLFLCLVYYSFVYFLTKKNHSPEHKTYIISKGMKSPSKSVRISQTQCSHLAGKAGY